MLEVSEQHPSIEDLIQIQRKANLLSIKIGSSGGTAEHRGSVCALHPAFPGSILGVPELFQ